MRDIDLYCMCLNDHHLSNIKKQGYIPVGLGNNKFNSRVERKIWNGFNFYFT